MLNIVFLCSGNGGNLRFLTEAIRFNWISDATIGGVITDRECLANQFARDEHIWTTEFDFSEKNQINLISQLKQLNPDIIITTVHKILSPAVVDAFTGKLINLHYSLLPAFGGFIGAKPIELALDYGAQLVGTTVHLVDAEVDAGKPLVQTAIPVTQEDTTETLMDIVFRCGCISLLNALIILHPDKKNYSYQYRSVLEVCDRPVLMNPQAIYCLGYEDEIFWKKLKSYSTTTRPTR